MSVVFEVAGVNKTFGGLAALSNIDLKVEDGITHAIIGPNGAGKSTLLNVCVGRIIPDTGTVNFLGEPLTGKKPHQINQLGVARVFQTPEIFPDLSLLQNMLMPSFSKRDGSRNFIPFRALRAERRVIDEAMAFLANVNLDGQHDRAAGVLSRGDKRRLELAMCLIQHPRLLLLDEPTAGMSRHDTNSTLDLLKQIKQGGLTIIIIEHDMHVVFSIADRISVLAQGKVLVEGNPEEVRGNPDVRAAYLGQGGQEEAARA